MGLTHTFPTIRRNAMQGDDEKAVVAEEAKAIEAVEVEEAEIDAYMDDGGEELTDDDRIGYLRTRYNQVLKEYKGLVLQKEEAEARKEEQLLTQLRAAFGPNFKARKYLVRELRRMGEEVKDRFIPLSS
jgi:hypothetical protein